MKVKELIQELQKFNPEMDVYIQDNDNHFMFAESVQESEIWQEDLSNEEGGYNQECVLIYYE